MTEEQKDLIGKTCLFEPQKSTGLPVRVVELTVLQITEREYVKLQDYHGEILWLHWNTLFADFRILEVLP